MSNEVYREVVGVVYWGEEPERTRIVTALCKRCARAWVQHDARNVLRVNALTLADCYLVSPKGRAHIQSFDGDPKTQCGWDATGKEWWWRE